MVGNMKFGAGLILGLVFGLGLGWKLSQQPKTEVKIEKPLLKYSIENLGKREYKSEIILDADQKFHFDSDGKKVTGLAHIPENCGKCPVIVQIRGYAEADKYYPGYGTSKTAEKFAQAGFISLAPDFLGYGGSASQAADIFEARFETYTTVMNLLAAISKWQMANGNIGIWGHSNGGQIALTVLEISGKKYPTVLWAPVTAGFPYSILYYMNDNQEGDKLLRRKLTNFENIYDPGQFNLLNYLDRINAVILLQQGDSDGSVPVGWSKEVIKRLSKLSKDVTYKEYSGADHNLSGAWGEAVEKDVEFFNNYLGLTKQ